MSVSGPTWIDENETDEKYIGKLERALSLAWLILKKINIPDCNCGVPCDCYPWYSLSHEARDVIKEIEDLK